MLLHQDCLLLTFSASDAVVLVGFPAAIFTLLLSHSGVIHSQLCCLRSLSDIHLLLKTCLVRVFQHTGYYFVVITEPLSHVSLSFDLKGCCRQALPSTGFSRQEHWSRSPFSSPGDLPAPGIELKSPALEDGLLLLFFLLSHHKAGNDGFCCDNPLGLEISKFNTL